MFKKVCILFAIASLCFGSLFADNKYSSGSKSGGSSSSYSAGSKSGGSSSSYSAGSRSGSSTPKSGSSYSAGTKSEKSSYSAGTPKSGSSYSAGTPTKPKSAGYSAGTKSEDDTVTTTKRPSGNFLSAQQTTQKQEESRAAFKKATTPQEKVLVVRSSPTYQNSTVRKTITHERYVTYETRSRDFYGPYYGQPISPYYTTFQSNPNFNIWFWMWLMERADANERSNWAYNHRSQISDTEWAALCQKDANLEARVRGLEAKGQAQNTDYIPAAMAENPDIMYNSHFVAAAAEDNSGPSVGVVLGWIFGIVAVVAIVGCAIYFLAIKEYNTNL